MDQLPIIVNPDVLKDYLKAIKLEVMEEATQQRPPRMRKIIEAAAETGLTYNAVRQLCLSGAVAHVRIGKSKIFVNLDDLIEYLNNNKGAIPNAAND